ncbi:HTH-type transcriptional repressor Bm3R1 [Labrenzia sp. THAF82]|uniref:TetR/AcrR family transcriptional regulator n=1 Tax=Labrenzia sp. THAF82 TaxID=2587861 RepID=UPI001268D4BC|nr:TetR/AcrR family transcriptional regulator [Labrenzia sp. THAF82]QFT33431.1 HTH-type transcriptional repressor Bm3R1 [Labrenzia sp. THAF82]
MPLQLDPQPRRQPKQLRSRMMVETTVEAARQIFAEHGFEAATTNQIADRAGISIGSLYQYFPNKDSLILAVHKKHHEEVLAVVKGAMDRCQFMPLKDAIRQIIVANLDMHMKTPRLHAEFDAWIPARSKLVDQDGFQSEMAQIVLNFLSQRPDVQQGDQLKPAVVVIMNMVRSVLHAAVGSVSDGESREKMLDHLCAGIYGSLNTVVQPVGQDVSVTAPASDGFG